MGDRVPLVITTVWHFANTGRTAREASRQDSWMMGSGTWRGEQQWQQAYTDRRGGGKDRGRRGGTWAIQCIGQPQRAAKLLATHQLPAPLPTSHLTKMHVGPG
jgi:hypothetical protein